MTFLVTLALPLLAALLGGPAAAQTASAPQGQGQTPLTPQQDCMRSCNTGAGARELSGEARQSFMRECLSGSVEAMPRPQLTAQQQKMRDCNAQAATRNLAGDGRQRFMSECLGGSTMAASRGQDAATGATGAIAAAQGGGRFASEAEAKRACSGEAVVWANPDTHVFHAAGGQFYGKTQQGGYMCQSAAEKAGYRLADKRQ